LDPQEQRCIRTSRGAAASGLKLENGTKTGGTYLKVLGVELQGEAFFFPQSRWRPYFRRHHSATTSATSGTGHSARK
jgi:hypothetical protein